MLCAMSKIAKSLLALIGFFFLSAIGLISYYQASGQYVDENGVLVEEFWALGLGTLSVLVAAVLGLIFALRVTLERRRRRLSH
jgi:hypothetical protein